MKLDKCEDHVHFRVTEIYEVCVFPISVGNEFKDNGLNLELEKFLGQLKDCDWQFDISEPDSQDKGLYRIYISSKPSLSKLRKHLLKHKYHEYAMNRRHR